MSSSSDVFKGLTNPTQEEWDRWHRQMLREREAALAIAGFDDAIYRDPKTAWSDRAFRQLFLFMYDASFYDGGYRTEKLIAEWKAAFGRIDSVLLWQGYPRIGFDERTQFDFYRQMPPGLRTEVVDVLHAHGIRVLLDYNPWDAGSYEELAEIALALNADGIMLDTMTDAPTELRRHLPNLVLAPELRIQDRDLSFVRQSWAQWFDLGTDPAILRHQWLVPKHRQYTIRRWDRDRRADIIFSFWSGSGLLLWENIFGTHNPYSEADRKLLLETSAVLDRYADLFAEGTWSPLLPGGVNRWDLGDRSIITARSAYEPPAGFTPVWTDTTDLQAFVNDGWQITPARPTTSTRTSPKLRPHAEAKNREGLVAVPGGDFEMVIRHERRECGCYALGATESAEWGWFYKDEITHCIHVSMTPYWIAPKPITRAQFEEFVRMTGYAFTTMPPGNPDDPITQVTLDDARAYATWRGQRLPTEAEWQRANLTQHQVWELTESEHFDGHTRFVMLRGGVSMPSGTSEWLPPRGPRPIDWHAKYILMGSDIDRSSLVGFRTVSD